MTTYQALAFSEANPQYRHCCLHLLIVAYTTILLQAGIVVYEIAATMFIYGHRITDHVGSPLFETSDVGVLVWGGCYLFAIGLACVGVRRTKPSLLSPLLVGQGLTILMAFIELFLLFGSLGRSAQLHINIWVTIFICFAVVCVESYFLWLWIRIWRYTQVKRLYILTAWLLEKKSSTNMVKVGVAGGNASRNISDNISANIYNCIVRNTNNTPSNRSYISGNNNVVGASNSPNGSDNTYNTVSNNDTSNKNANEDLRDCIILRVNSSDFSTTSRDLMVNVDRLKIDPKRV